ncbi:cytochrome P450 [Halobium salinum]|uniref:Cytochrome P450 n=1 Tax=Halobium salinum TaxID=1364940 RepID=A0ABD5PDK9_9EURY|nr:cytochrome P450 [Halobium salinum]
MTSRPPTPAPHPVVGNTYQFAQSPFEFIDKAKDDHGDVFNIDLFGRPDLYVLTHPDHVRQVLVDEPEAFAKTQDFARAFGDGLLAIDDARWADHNRMLQPMFQAERIREHTDVIRERVERRLDTWEAGDVIDVEAQMNGLALEILFAVVLGRDLGVGEDDHLREAANRLGYWFEPISWTLPSWVPTPARRKFRDARATLREEGERLIDERREEGVDGDDLLSTLLRASEGDAPVELSDEQIYDQMVTMIFAGHETTATVMTFAWYLLATHPAVRRRLHEELDAVLGDEPPTADTLGELDYLDHVVNETMRLYPPVHTIPRRTRLDVEVGDYRIPAGEEVHLSVLQIHRDGRFYEDPLGFHPERWDDEEDAGDEDDRENFAFVPFGAGRRSCLGRPLALTEAKTVLATVMQRCDLEATKRAVELGGRITSKPKEGVPMRVTPLDG